MSRIPNRYCYGLSILDVASADDGIERNAHYSLGFQFMCVVVQTKTNIAQTLNG